MKILKPVWISHQGKPIFSIDIHPDGSRCATGGQGDNAGRVTVWNMEPVRHITAEKNPSVPKILCSMDNHLACVNSVRWSYDGRFLASAGDDKLVMIWQCSSNADAFGTPEQWRATNYLRGHSEDVLDVAWSENKSYLASCSVDNTVIVWNALQFPEKVAVLRGHSGLVKGVAWDPIGKYLASQADDKSLRIWRTSDWKEETKVTKPFEECGGTTHVLRLNWSPDGHYIVSAHAMNNSGPTAQIIERNGWKADLDFVGHRKAITCVRFSSRILRRSEKTKGRKQNHQYTCCAVGSRDRSISVWLTAVKRPVMVMNDVFDSSVVDLSWSRSGQELVCCSDDGTVAFLTFDESEIGVALTDEEQVNLQRAMYGDTVFSTNKSTPLIEATAMLEVHRKPQEDKLVPASVSKRSTVKPQTVVSSNTKQIETRTKDGKRRIQPIFLAAQPDVGEAPQPFISNPVFSSSKETSQIVREVSKDPVDGVAELFKSPKSGSHKATSARTPHKEEHEQTPATKPRSPATTKQEKASEAKAESGKGVGKRKAESPREQPPKKKDRRGRPKKLLHNIVLPPTPTHAPPIVAEPTVVYSEKGLGLYEANLLLPFSTKVKDTSLVLEINTCSVPGGTTIYRVQTLTEAGLSWEHGFSSRPCAVACSCECTVVACADNTLNWLSTTSGRRRSPCLTLDSPVHWLETSQSHCLAVTIRGSLSVWDTRLLVCLLNQESVSSIVPDSSVEILKCSLTEQGCPIVTISNGISYTFSSSLKGWVSVHKKQDHLLALCDHNNESPQGPLSSLESHKKPSHVSSSGASEAVQRMATLDHLESQLAASLVLKSANEYRFWLNAYVCFLVDQGYEAPLREVLEEMANCSGSGKHILGLSKKTLFVEVLPILGRNLELQRLYLEYKERLDAL